MDLIVKDLDNNYRLDAFRNKVNVKSCACT